MGTEEERRRLSRPSPHRAIVAVLLATGLCASFLFTLVVPIQAKLPDLLGAAREDTAWVVTATLLASAVITPIAGRLGDMYGKRRIILWLLVITTVGSIVVALSSQILGVVLGRTLQGAMAGVIPLGIAVMRDVLPAHRVDGAIAMMSSTLGVGGALGLPVSALITEYADWHVLFWVTAAMSAAAFGLVLWIVPVSVLRDAGRFDLLGALGLSAGLIGILLAVSRGDQWGWLSPATLGCGIGGVVLLVLWAWYQLRVREPLLDLRVAARRPVLLTNLASIGMGFALFASNVVYPQLLEMPASSGVGFGLPLLIASLVVMPSGILMMLLSPAAGRIARAIGPKVLLLVGAASLIAAYAFTIVLHTEVWHILFANLLIGVGIGFGYASMPMLIMRSVPQNETGASNGLNALCRSLGTSTAAAVMGAVLAASSAQSGTGMPSADGFQLSFVLGIAAAAVAFVLAFLIPSAPRRSGTPRSPRTEGAVMHPVGS
ncbi:MFS family permease [Microbacterium resistens]|uniref:MFS family permease n=1 Tax=Microbacterium resistens TaxID=156977 RepID=A0ABU1SAK3_9MICO|nr:MFS transporter [Microbacterium resistens]MDR6866638.1 MFS family permease [Microbacterium resistens]